jgi:RNA polymerase sigma-70 factor (ECF subfamily)
MASSNEHLPALLARDLNRYFERLVLTYQDQLYAFVLLRIRSPQAAQEVVQSALERAYYALKNYPTRQIQLLKLEPWLYEITRNVFYNYVRENHTRASRLPSVSLDLSGDSLLLDLEDQSLGPDEEVCRRESRHELEMQVSRLPDLYQETMKLYYFNDLTSREIAERLNQPIGTVKANVHRGTQLLRKMLNTDAKKMR